MRKMHVFEVRGFKMMGSLKQFVILSLKFLDIALLPLEFKELHLANPQLFKLT
jgi:hypothetical protein